MRVLTAQDMQPHVAKRIKEQRMQEITPIHAMTQRPSPFLVLAAAGLQPRVKRGDQLAQYPARSRVPP